MTSQQAITLYITRIKHDHITTGFKKPIAIVSHWAVCIDDICYELRGGVKKNGEKESFVYKPIPKDDWKAQRKYPADDTPTWLGYTSGPYSRDLIHEVAQQVWEKTLHKKYAFDENNCQAFVRLLVELIGDSIAKEAFPRFLDQWVKNAAIGRDGTVFALATGMTLMAVGLVTVGVDMGSTAALGFGIAGTTVFRSTAALFNLRDSKSKYIQKSQKEIRDNIRRTYGVELA